MDFMEKITELRAKKGQLLTQAQALVDEGKIEEANEFTSQMEAINTRLPPGGVGQGWNRGRGAPVHDGALHGGKAQGRGQGRDKPSLPQGAAQAAYNFSKNHVEDKRSRGSTTRCWASMKAAAPTVIQTDFAGMILRAPCSRACSTG